MHEKNENENFLDPTPDPRIFFFEISRKFSFGSTNTVMTGISVLVNHIFHISTFTYVSMRHRTKLALVFFADAAFNLSILLCTISPIISVSNDLLNCVSGFSGMCPSGSNKWKWNRTQQFS